MAYEGPLKGPGGINVDECLRVAKAIELSDTFAMSRYVNECGTPGCIVGHTLTAQERARSMKGLLSEPDVAQKRLGISAEIGAELFWPKHEDASYYKSEPGMRRHISNAHAAACLRNLALTGEVDWLSTKPKEG